MEKLSEILTPKQQEYFFAEDRRINVLSGSVRSGKTWISLLKWAVFVASMPESGSYMMVGKTLQTLDENCLGLLEELVGEHFKYKRHAKSGRLYGRHVRLEGADNERAAGKIKGSTLTGVYIDELTEIPKSFYDMCLTRLSVAGARFFATTNPDNPNHYVKTQIIDNKDIDAVNWHFLIDDNTKLPAEFIENTKKEHTGVFYDRYVLGLWKAAEGAIYKLYTDNPAKCSMNEKGMPPLIQVNIGVDFGGNKSATAFVAVGFTAGYRSTFILDEERRCAATDNPTKLEEAFIDFCTRVKRKYPITYYAYCDSAEQTLIHGLQTAVLKARIGISVRNARKHAVKSRIRLVTGLMGQGRFFVAEHCQNVRAALENAVWDSKKPEDTRLDNGTYDVDTLDAMEYALEQNMNELGMGYLISG